MPSTRVQTSTVLPTVLRCLSAVLQTAARGNPWRCCAQSEQGRKSAHWRAEPEREGGSPAAVLKPLLTSGFAGEPPSRFPCRMPLMRQCSASTRTARSRSVFEQRQGLRDPPRGESRATPRNSSLEPSFRFVEWRRLTPQEPENRGAFFVVSYPAQRLVIHGSARSPGPRKRHTSQRGSGFANQGNSSARNSLRSCGVVTPLML
jgi:hypothetical protein